MLSNRLALALVCLALTALSGFLVASGNAEVQATGLVGLAVAVPLLIVIVVTARPAPSRRVPAPVRRTYTIRNYHLAR